MGKILKSGKRVLFSAICLLLLSCAHLDEQSSPSCQSCGTAPQSAFDPKDAIPSMVLITGTITQGEKELGQWVGSGSVVAHDKKLGTLVLTAGHVCVITGAPPVKEGEEPYKWTLSVTDKTDTVYPGHAAFVVRKFDACLINTTLIDAPILNLSENKPAVGDPISNVSAPFGVFSKNVSLIFEGRYGGDFNVRQGFRISSYTMPTAAGASGSPILNSNGDIVGVVSQVNGYFHHIALSPTFDQLQSLFAGKAAADRINFIN